MTERHAINVRLRPVTQADLPYMYEIGLDPASNQMAGTKPRTYDAFMERWAIVLADDAIVPRIILASDAAGEVRAGSISVFQQDGHDSLGYWLERAHWGRGIGSRAVGLMLAEVRRRPLYATAAADNLASLRILQRHGFREISREQSPETDRYLARLTVNLVLT